MTNEPLRCLLVDNDEDFLSLSLQTFEQRFANAGMPATFIPAASRDEARRLLSTAAPGTFDLVMTDMLFAPLDDPDAPPEEHVNVGADVIRDAVAARVGFVVGYTKSGDTTYARLHASARSSGVDYFCTRADLAAPEHESVISEIVERLRALPDDTAESPATQQADPSRVAVVHGAHNAAREALFPYLRAIGLKPTEFCRALNWTGEGTPPLAATLDQLFARTQAVVVLLTPDESVQLHPAIAQQRNRDERGFQPRPNVYFELGMAWALNRKRTILVSLGDIRTPSDLEGLHVLELSDEPSVRNELYERLETADCAVERTEAMYSAGDFSAAIASFAMDGS